MERLVNSRLVWLFEEKQKLCPEPADFGPNRSTEDQVAYIAQEVEDAFRDKKHTLAVWVDMEKALDKVWREGLKLKLKRCGVFAKLYTWIVQHRGV